MEPIQIPPIHEISSITDRAYLERLRNSITEQYNRISEEQDELLKNHRSVLEKESRYRSVRIPSLGTFLWFGLILLFSCVLNLFPYHRYISAGTSLYKLIRLLSLIFPLAAVVCFCFIGKSVVLRAIFRLTKEEKSECDNVNAQLSALRTKERYLRQSKIKVLSCIDAIDHPKISPDHSPSSSVIPNTEEYDHSKERSLSAHNDPSSSQPARRDSAATMMESDQATIHPDDSFSSVKEDHSHE